MEKFINFKSKVMPLNSANVDTDQIIPKQFLKRIERTGFGEFLFLIGDLMMMVLQIMILF